MRKVLSRFKRKKDENSPNSGFSTPITPTPSSARTLTPASRSISPLPPTDIEIESIREDNSAPQTTRPLDAAESRSLNTTTPEEPVAPPAVVIQGPLQRSVDTHLLPSERSGSEARFSQAAGRDSNEGGHPRFDHKVIPSGGHTSLEPPGQPAPSAPPQETLPPTTAAPQVSSFMLNNQINAGGDSNIYNFVGNLEVNKDTTTRLQKLKGILNPVNAAWDSYEADQRSKCFENTRVQLLDKIEAWIAGGDKQAPIFVLDGVAGIGKSTIAQTIAERAFNARMLGASFFFTTNEEERATSKHFFPTIAFQIARHNTLFAQQLSSALEQDPDAAQKTIQQQVSLLIANPLQNSSISVKPPILMVIDALDECRDNEAYTLLTLLAQYIPQLPQLRLFITARPEQHLRRILNKDSNHDLFHLHEIDDWIVQADIRLYLKHALSAESVQDIFPDDQPPWQPSASDMLMLCGICGTLFIIASTATKFILDTKAADPEGRLTCLLEGVSREDYSGSSQTDVMDKFYIRIIYNAAPDGVVGEVDRWFDRYQTIMGAIIVLQNPLPCAVLAQLLNLHRSDITKGLLHLHSLVAPSGLDMIFRVHHKSFPDFVTNPDRIQRALAKLSTAASNLTPKFLIDTREHHRQLAAACFRVMDENLKFNIGNISLEEWFFDKADISSLQDISFGEELTYAASHWAFHLSAAGELDGGLQEDFRRWAYTHIMAWLEVMSILGQIKRGHDMLDMALNAIVRRTQGAQHQSWSGKDEVRKMISDARRFLLQSSEVVKLTPMHIYWSALPFTPRNNLLYKTYGEGEGLSIVSGIEREWDAALVTMAGHSDYVRAVAFSPNGKVLASASDDDTVRLWDGNMGGHLITLEGHSGGVNDVTFSPNGASLASSSDDHTIRLWDVTTGSHLITLNGHSGSVRSVAFSPDGSRLASGSDDRSIRLWDGKTGAHLITIKGHSSEVISVAFSPDGLRLASASHDCTVCLWDAGNGAHITTFDGHSGEVNSVAFSPDGLRLASASHDHTIRLWEATTGAHIITLEGHSNFVFSIVFSPDGSRLASGSADDSIVRLWDATTGYPIITFGGHSGDVYGVAFSPDGSRLASASSDATVRLWDVKAGSLKGHSGDDGLSSDAVSIVYSPSNYAICSQNAKPDTIHTHSGRVLAMAHSPDGTRFVSGSGDGTPRLWDGKTGAYITTLHGHSDWVRAVAFSPDGARLASGSDDTTIRLWDGKTGDHICTLDGHSDWVMAVAFSPDGSTLASGSSDMTIRLCDGKTGANITTLNGHSAWVRAIAFSPNGSRLVSASNDQTFRVWDGRSGCRISTINSDSGIGAIAFSPTGSTLALMETDYDGIDDVIFTDATLYLRTINNIRPISLEKHFKSVASFTFLPSASHPTFSPPIATTDDVIDPLFTHPAMSDYPLRVIALGRRQNPSLSGLVYLEVPADGEPVMIPFCWFPPHFDVTAFSVDSTGSSIAVGCQDGRVLLLDISKVSLL